MTSISEIQRKIPPIVDVCLTIYSTYRMFESSRFAWENLQLAFAWLKEAGQDLQQDLDISVEGEKEKINLQPPTLIGVEDQLNYVKEQLTELSKGTFIYAETGLPPQVQYKVLQAYNKITDAKFYNDISTQYYGQIRTARENAARNTTGA